jgi:hypothetical protein
VRRNNHALEIPLVKLVVDSASGRPAIVKGDVVARQRHSCFHLEASHLRQAARRNHRSMKERVNLQRLDERSEVSVNFGAASMPVASEVGTRMQRQITGHTWRRRSREQVDRAGIYTSLSGTVPASNYVSFIVNFQDEPERIWLSYSGT